MRHLIIFTILITLNLVVLGQKTKEPVNAAKANWERVSGNSISIKDWPTYIVANQYLDVIDESNDTLYKKNILFAYFENRQYESCFILAKELTEKYKQDISFLDFYARSADNLKRFGDASIAYEKLYTFTNNPTYGYLLANAQYYMGRYIESMQSIQSLKNNKANSMEFLDFTLTNSDKKQAIPISAALYNLEGMVFFEMKNIESSRSSFSKAIEIFPSFEVAKENLESIHQ